MRNPDPIANLSRILSGTLERKLAQATAAEDAEALGKLQADLDALVPVVSTGPGGSYVNNWYGTNPRDESGRKYRTGGGEVRE